MTAATTRRIRVAVRGDDDFSTGFRSFAERADVGLDVVPASDTDVHPDGDGRDDVDCIVLVAGDGARDGEAADTGVDRTAGHGGPIVAVVDDGEAVSGVDAVVVADADAAGYRRVAAHVEAAVRARRGTAADAVAASGRDLHEAILESIDDAVYAIRADGTIVYVNRRYARMKGTDRDSLIGTNIYGLVSDETAERARLERAALVRLESDVSVVEYEFTPVDREPFPAEMRFTLVDGPEGVDRVGVIRDITHRQEREDLLRRKNERLEEFTGVVSHDLRSPLNVASGRLALAREECDSEHLDDVEGALDRMDSLIEGLLTLARGGEDVGELACVDLASTVRECLDTVGLPSERVRVRTDLTVRADRGRLKQLLENLLRNAVDHGGDDVTVTVGDCPGGFFVEDDGPGIDPAEREDVFDAGVSISAAGTGFGLAIVSRIVAAHGWTVDVTEGDAGGARFEITGVDG